jgi:AraC-like DNA-binding protein
VPYAEIAPSPLLRPWVECFWTRAEEGRVGGQHRILPDGCADFVFDLSDGSAIAVGTMTRPLLIDGSGSHDFLGVRFRPGRAAAFLRIPLAELTDARVSLGDLWRDVPERMDVSTLESALLRRLVPAHDARVDAAIAKIAATGARIDDVARDIGISRQHLARQFQHHVGVSPKTFARVMRFRRLLESLPRERAVDWASLAAGHGYYDQSHLIDEFRELAGTTPGDFLK